MSLSTFNFVSLLLFISSAVLCIPQIPNQASDDTSSDGGSSTGAQNIDSNTPSDTTFLPISLQNTPNIVALQGNGLEPTHSTDSTVVGAGSEGGAESSTPDSEIKERELLIYG